MSLSSSSRCSSWLALARPVRPARPARPLPERPLPAAAHPDALEDPVDAPPVPEGQHRPRSSARTPSSRARCGSSSASARTPTRSARRPPLSQLSADGAARLPGGDRASRAAMPEPANREQRRRQQRLTQPSRPRPSGGAQAAEAQAASSRSAPGSAPDCSVREVLAPALVEERPSDSAISSSALLRAVDDARHAQEAVDHAVVAVALGLDAGEEEPLRVGLGLVAQHVGLGGDDDRPRQAPHVVQRRRRDVGVVASRRSRRGTASSTSPSRRASGRSPSEKNEYDGVSPARCRRRVDQELRRERRARGRGPGGRRSPRGSRRRCRRPRRSSPGRARAPPRASITQLAAVHASSSAAGYGMLRREPVVDRDRRRTASASRAPARCRRGSRCCRPPSRRRGSRRAPRSARASRPAGRSGPARRRRRDPRPTCTSSTGAELLPGTLARSSRAPPRASASPTGGAPASSPSRSDAR